MNFLMTVSLSLAATTVLAGSPVSAMPWYQDKDGDGYGTKGVAMWSENQPVGYVLNDHDCDDRNPQVNVEVDCVGLLQGSSGVNPALAGFGALLLLGAALGGGGSTSGTN